MKKLISGFGSVGIFRVILCVITVAAMTASGMVESSSLGILNEGATQIQTNSSKTNMPSTKRSRAAAGIRSAEPLTPTITATLQDSFTDGDGDMKAEPGQTVTYTVNITPSADPAGATGVMYNHSVDSHTSLVASSIRTTPVARPDTYTAIGNVRIDINTVVTGVLNNDSDADGDTFTASAAATSTNGGNVAMNANGTFTYNPPRGFEGTDTFTYTLTDSTGKIDTGIVSVVVTGVIWFIDNNAAGGGDGRLTAPYNTLAAFQAVNNGTGGNPAAGDNIFIYRQTATDYTGPITLLNNQRLVGQGATASILTITGLGTPSGTNQLPATGGTNPNITTTAAATNAINLSVGGSNLLRGFTVGNTTGSKIASGANFGTLTVSEVMLNGTGQALSLTSGTLTATFTSVTSTPGAGVRAIDLTTVAGTSTFGTGTITGNTAEAFRVNGSNPTITYSGTITQNSAGRVVDIQSTTGGAITFNTGTITGGAPSLGVNINAANGNVSFANGLTLGTSGSRMTNQAVTITGGTGTYSLGVVSIFTSAAQGIVATNADGTINTTSGTVDSSNATAVNIDGPGGLTTLAMTLTTASSSGAAKGITIQDTNGSFTVNGTGTTNGTGGTIQNITTRGAEFIRATGITLKNMTFTNACTVDFPAAPTGLSLGNNTADNAVIHLQSVITAALDNVDITGSAEQGINGHNVSNFSYNNSTMLNVGGGADEDGIHFYNMVGTCTINSTTITSSGDDNINIQNNNNLAGDLPPSTTGTITINGGSANTGVLGSGYLFGIRGTMNTTIDILNVTSNNNFSGGIVADCFDTATMDIEVSGSSSTNNNDGISISNNNGNSKFDIHDNVSFAGTDFGRINVLKAAFSTGGTFEGKIRNNPIVVANGQTADGVTMQNLGGGTLKASITGNTFDYAGTQRALYIAGGQDGNATLEVTVTGNAFDIKLDGTGNAVNAILAQVAVASPSGDPSSMCADIGGAGTLKNTFTHSLGGTMAGGDIRVRQRFVSNVRLPGYGGGGTDTTAAGAYLDGRNSVVSPSTVTIATSISGGGACLQPAAPTQEEATVIYSSPSKSIESSTNDNISAGIASEDFASQNREIHQQSEHQVSYADLRTNNLGYNQAFNPLMENLDSAFAIFNGSAVSRSDLSFVSHPAIVAAQKKPQTAPQGAGGTVTRNIGGIPQNKTVTITYDVVIDDPAGVTSISTQGTVTGTNFASKVTDDPDTGTANDPTVTPIDLVDTTTSVASSNTSVMAGDLVTFTATIARITGSAGTITGTVQFKEDAVNLGSPVAVTGSGPFTAQLQTRCLTVGSHTITAVYSGDTNFKTSTGTLVGMETVAKPNAVTVDDSFAGSGCTDLGGGLVLNRNAFTTIAGGQAGVATGGTVNVADGTYAENVAVAMDTVTLAGNVQITGNLTLSGGTFNSTSGTLSITGNFNQTGGAFNHTGGRVAMIGPAAQTLGGTVQTTFNTLTINNANGVSLGVTKIGVGVLELVSGNLNASTFSYELSASGSINRTSGHVLGNLKKTFASTGAFTYHVGTANGYSPMSVTVTAGTGDLTVKAVQGPQPILNAMKSLQRYWTLAGSGITVNMTFTYLDPPDVPGTSNEALYRVIRVSGGSAFIYLDSPPTSFVDETANTINVQNISGFSDWTAGEATAPTEAKLDSFNATGCDAGALIEWRTGSEVDNLGFNLYRDEDGKRVPVNSQMVAGSALVAGSGVTIRAGQSYAWWDDAASKSGAQYWLESIDLKGQSDWHGPFFSKFMGGDGPARGNSSMLGRGEGAQAGLTVPVERAALPTAAKTEQITLQSGLAGQAAVKMWVKREGFYRVTASELAAAGLDPRAETRLLQLYADGQEIPINVIADKDGLLSAIEFYGRGLDAAFTDQRVFWLVSGSESGLRIQHVKGSGQPTASQSFLYTAERRDRTIYFSGLRNGDRENFFGAVIAASPVDLSLTIQHVDQAAIGTATMEVALQGVTTLPHKVWVYLNGVFAGDVSFDGQARAVSRFDVAQSLLRSGDNQVRLVAQGGPTDISLVDYIRLSYWHSFTADDNALRLTTPGNQGVTIGGFTSGAIRVLDVTDPDAPQELGAKIEQQKTGFAVTVASPGAGERRLLATTDDQSSKPAKISANQPSRLRTTAHAADLVIIARRDLYSAIEPLRALRSKQGLKVELADIEDVFDEFSFGTKSPQALKDFLRYATTSWKGKPRYVLLVGDASYDAKNYLGLGDWDLVPTRLIDTSLMETASDDALADFNGDGIADLAVGRLAARTPAEASAMVRKIIAYETSAPLESMLLVADINNGFDFESASTQLRALIPGNLRVEQINRGELGDATAKSRLIDAITRGQKVVNYMGHGSVNLWSGSLLTNEDAGNLTNGERLPLFVMMTCLNGYFHDPALDSLAESLLKAENGGAVAAWTSTSMTEPGDQLVLNRQLYQLLFTPGNTLTLGEATMRAKAAVTDGDIRRTWVLLGDPTMRLK